MDAGAAHTYDLNLLKTSLEKWRRSPGLRLVYGDIYRAIRQAMIPGPSLELGSGIGMIKEHIPGVVTSDVEKTLYADRKISCYAISREPAAWSNLIALDVLHHLRRPMDFFQSAAHALAENGRIILAEPAATPFGRFFYSRFHHEPLDLPAAAPPCLFDSPPSGEIFANMAMAHAIFIKHRIQTEKELGRMGLRRRLLLYRDFLAYPLSGGYSKPQLLPAFMLKALLALERKLPQPFLRFWALRLFIVVEKSPPDGL